MQTAWSGRQGMENVHKQVVRLNLFYLLLSDWLIKYIFVLIGSTNFYFINQSDRSRQSKGQLNLVLKVSHLNRGG